LEVTANPAALNSERKGSNAETVRKVAEDLEGVGVKVGDFPAAPTISAYRWSSFVNVSSALTWLGDRDALSWKFREESPGLFRFLGEFAWDIAPSCSATLFVIMSIRSVSAWLHFGDLGLATPFAVIELGLWPYESVFIERFLDGNFLL
jgi:hypothetical protein